MQSTTHNCNSTLVTSNSAQLGTCNILMSALNQPTWTSLPWMQVNYLSHWLLVRTLTEPLPQDCKAPSWQNPFSRRYINGVNACAANSTHFYCGFENHLPLLHECRVFSRPGEVESCRGAAQSHEREQGTRVVLLSSCMHRGGRLDFFDLQVTPLPTLLAFRRALSLGGLPVLCYCRIASSNSIEFCTRLAFGSACPVCRSRTLCLWACHGYCRN